MRVLIATGKRPKDDANARQVFEMIRESAKEGGLSIASFYWVEGPGCTNLAFDLVGDDAEAEQFANALCMALMPAKWSTTQDDMPQGDVVELNWKK